MVMPRLHSANNVTPPNLPLIKGRRGGDVVVVDNYSPNKFSFWKRIRGLRYLKISSQFIKFAVVGIGNTAIDIGLLNLLLYWHWSVLLANTLAFLVAAINSYFFNKYWTFGDKTSKWQWQLPFYITVVAIGLGLSDLFIYVLSIIFHWDVNVVKILSIAVIGLWNFLAPKFLIFKK